MKKTVTILAALLLLCASAFAQDAKSIYNKYSDEDGVSAVFISPAMFKMIGKIPSLDLGSDGSKVDITPIVKSLKGFYLLNTSDKAVGSKLSSDIKKLLNGGKFEMMMEAKEDGETMRIYTTGDDDTVTSFVMMALDGSETTFISMDGLISRKDFEKMMEGLAK